MKKVIIIGAGPAGLLLAHYLLSKDQYQIEIYERLPDPRTIAPSTNRTFPIGLQTRGLKAIQAIPGLDSRITEEGIWSQGALIHRKRGTPRFIDRKTPLLLIDRNRFVRVLLDHLLERDGHGRVNLYYNCACVDANWTSQTVTFQPIEGELFIQQFDQLVAADGVHSQVRTLLMTDKLLECEKTPVPDAYKSIFVPRFSVDGSVELAGDRVHTWSLGNGIRLLLAPQPDDWLHGTIVFPPDKNPFESLNSGEEVLEFIKFNVHPIGSFITMDEATDLLNRPMSRITSVQCDQMHVGDNILLIGDAIHAVSPSIGQGCNASLQDVQIFSDLLDSYQDDWGKTLSAFTESRLPDVHALQDLSDYSFPRSKRMSLEFITRLILGKKLQKWVPQIAPHILKPLPMELIMESDLSYSEVLSQTQSWIKRVKRSMKHAS